MPRTIRVYKEGRYWVAKQDGASKVSLRKTTQKEAYLAAREIALNQGLTITVYYPTGGIQKVITPKRNSKDDGCFITTACTNYYGLGDNCNQLQTLRHFRDTHLLQTDTGKSLVHQYYSIAPKIVKLLNKTPQKNILYSEIFYNINSACDLINQGKHKEARELYIKIVSHLAKQFKII